MCLPRARHSTSALAVNGSTEEEKKKVRKASRPEEPRMLRCRLEADCEKHGSENGDKNESSEEQRKKPNDLGTLQRRDLITSSLPDLSFLP